MSNQDIDKAYVSPFDKFFYEYDATHEKSASQLKEIRKYQRIYLLRDHARTEKDQNTIWEGF